MLVALTELCGSPAPIKQHSSEHIPPPPHPFRPSLQVTTYRTKLVVAHVLNSLLTCPMRSLVH